MGVQESASAVIGRSAAKTGKMTRELYVLSRSLLMSHIGSFLTRILLQSKALEKLSFLIILLVSVIF